ncbi:MAG TPA: type II toxin-antitoxin system prevent-host-death family antitoxin [Terracidiphilus sp.]|jgi:prevent-host-death family protein|nr:type II toxin-antitoxin system prevent-host-death family antitoxin [Terracidiphilus sp.]
MPKIGIFEAKTKLSEIVKKVERGERFTITVRGVAKAEVVPIQTPTVGPSHSEVTAAHRRLRNPSIKGISPEEVRDALERGR